MINPKHKDNCTSKNDYCIMVSWITPLTKPMKEEKEEIMIKRH